MSSIQGGKNKYLCLYSLVRKECPSLYECVNDLCIDGLFRNYRYKNTFLLPPNNGELCKHIAKLIDDDKDEEAIAQIKGLMLKDHQSKKTLTKSAKIGTANNHVLKSPEKVAEDLTETKLVSVNKEGAVVNVVLKYNGARAPASEEGEKIMAAKVGANVRRGGGESDEKKELDAIVSKLHVHNDHKKTFNNFLHAVAKIVDKVNNKDHVPHFLAANPILSFAFLTMNGHENALIKVDELKEMDFDNQLGDVDALNDLMENAEFDRAFFNKINSKRGHLLQQKGDRNTLPGELPKAYKQLIAENETLNLLFGKCPEQKLLMDELRFLYDDAVNNDSELDDVIKHIKTINWAECERHSIMSDSKLYKSLIKCPEAFVSGPTLFVKSIYFIYIPINGRIEGALESNKNGGAAYGSLNPTSINAAVFKGGAARRAAKSGASTSLSRFVKTLSAGQRTQLKNLL